MYFVVVVFEEIRLSTVFWSLSFENVDFVQKLKDITYTPKRTIGDQQLPGG